MPDNKQRASYGGGSLGFRGRRGRFRHQLRPEKKATAPNIAAIAAAPM